MKMWGGRFDHEPDDSFIEFTSSLGFDARLYPYDLKCTSAWVNALEESGVVHESEEKAIQVALDDIKEELDTGAFDFTPGDEDIHTAIERRLTELIGPAGGKVRTGRSRNDQVATDMRLFVMEQCTVVSSLIRNLQQALLGQARNNLEIVLPGHTHLQQAQPVLLSHMLLAFVYMFERDIRRLETASIGADCMPLGSGALAGTSLRIDREKLAGRLGFSRPSENSIDAVSDRDFICDLLYSLTVAMVHLSRLAEQIILWCSQEFGLAELDDSWATGSSLMPQKKNPDGPELIRAKTGRTMGSLVSMLAVLKGLPLAYNRDLQEDKEGLFDAIDTIRGCLGVMARTVETMKFNSERASEILEDGFITATDLADYLVGKGLEFPEAHRVVGEIVTSCMKEGTRFSDLKIDALARFSELLDENAVEWLSVEESLARRDSVGGTSRAEVIDKIAAAEKMVSG